MAAFSEFRRKGMQTPVLSFVVFRVVTEVDQVIADRTVLCVFLKLDYSANNPFVVDDYCIHVTRIDGVGVGEVTLDRTCAT